jgi:von Willebrand factor type A domain
MTNVYILLDRSGSMGSIWDEAIESINTYANGVKDTARIYVAAFDSVAYDVLRTISADKWVDLQTSEAHPRGSTPLFDAAGKLIETVEKDKPEKAVLVFMTDGYENNSTEFSHDTIKKRLKWVEKNGWAVVFLGANFDKVDEAGKMFGASKGSTVNFRSGKMNEGMSYLVSKTMSYSSLETSGLSADAVDGVFAFTDTERSSLSGQPVSSEKKEKTKDKEDKKDKDKDDNILSSLANTVLSALNDIDEAKTKSNEKKKSTPRGAKKKGSANNA